MPMLVYPALLILLLAGCRTATPAPVDFTGESLTFIAHDHAIDGPEAIRAGHITVHLFNHGEHAHRAQFIKLARGKTAEDLMAAMDKDPSMPEWGHYVGGPNAVMAGGTVDATIDLEAGEYAVICQIFDRRGTWRLQRGMVKGLHVAEGLKRRGGAMSEAADSVIRTVDFRFNVQQPLRAGQQRVRVVNRGAQPHEALLVQLDAGVRLKDYLASRDPSGSSPTRGRPIGGLAVLDPDLEGTFLVKLTPGRYVLVCSFQDPLTGVPHYDKGMATEFEVE